MLKNGVGLNITDYKAMLNSAAKEHKISKKAIDNAFNNCTRGKDLNRGEYQGGVSFLPTLEQAKAIAKPYAKSAGEWKGNLLDIFVKAHARDIKKSFNSPEVQSIFLSVTKKYGGAKSAPVVVQVTVPVSAIVNKKDIGQGVELYTSQKVPARYIDKIIEN